MAVYFSLNLADTLRQPRRRPCLTARCSLLLGFIPIVWHKVKLQLVSSRSMFGKSKNLQMRTAAGTLLEVEIISSESHFCVGGQD